MTAAHTVSPHDPVQTDLIRYFDRDLVTVDRIAIEAKARRERAAAVGKMFGDGTDWLRRRLTHLGETRAPAASCYVDHVQF
ncbi:MAG: RSP_7527 family protein [Reyranellaceae bacterium]